MVYVGVALALDDWPGHFVKISYAGAELEPRDIILGGQFRLSCEIEATLINDP